jgi:hypothetical protein
MFMATDAHMIRIVKALEGIQRELATPNQKHLKSTAPLSKRSKRKPIKK